MESQSLPTVVRRLRQVAAPPAGDGTDAELVGAFTVRGDTRSFERIVRRHGPMVLGVCRRVLRDATDADDAFQATFLVLIRRAGSLRQPDRLGAWLHQVAHRTARKLRAIRLARHARETELSDLGIGEPPADTVWRELRPVFDQELDQLPEKLRLPAVLCFLEGHSKREAARTLGWPEGTLAGRLQQARERLRVRFTARGLTLSAGALAAALFEGVGSAALPERLLTSTIHLAATGSAGAVASAGVRALADGVSQAMVMTKLKALAATVLIAGILGTGTGVVLVPVSGRSEVVAADPPKEAAKKDAKGDRKRIDLDRGASLIADLQGRLKAEPTNKNNVDNLIMILSRHAQSLRTEIERIAPQVQSGWVKQAELDKLNTELRDTETQLTRMQAGRVKDPERDALAAEVDVLTERAAFEERLVKKGYMTESQLKKTRAEIARAEAALANWDARKAADPRRAALEELIRKMEEIVETKRQGVDKGVAPRGELLEAERSLLEYKVKLLELTDRAPETKPAARRDPVVVLDELFDLASRKEEDLNRAETLFKQNAISLQEIRQRRAGVSRLKAEMAEQSGDYAAAAKHRESVATQLEAEAADAKKLFERKLISRGEVRAVEVSLAEAKVEVHRTAVRRHLAEIVAVREQELKEAKTLFDTRAISAEELRQAEWALSQAKLRLAESR